MVADKHRLAAYHSNHCWRAFRGYTNIDDRERPWTRKIKVLSDFFCITLCRKLGQNLVMTLTLKFEKVILFAIFCQSFKISMPNKLQEQPDTYSCVDSNMTHHARNTCPFSRQAIEASGTKETSRRGKNCWTCYAHPLLAYHPRCPPQWRIETTQDTSSGYSSKSEIK